MLLEIAFIMTFLKPAKDLGNREILVKSSEIHYLLKLSNRYPAVCSAMEGKKIEEEYGVKVLKQKVDMV